jgi:hypothetical protein
MEKPIQSAKCAVFWVNSSWTNQVTTMFRAVLAIYLLLLSLTGPSPCCCTMARFAAIVISAADAGQQPPACCGGLLTGKSQSQDNQQTPIPLDKHCKCVKSVCANSSPQKLEVVIDASWSWLDHLCLELSSTSPLDPVDFASATAHFTGRDLRVALCSWRC